MQLNLSDAKCSHSIGLGVGELSYMDKPDEKQCPEHRKHMINERWCDYSTTKDIITFSFLSQMQR